MRKQRNCNCYYNGSLSGTHELCFHVQNCIYDSENSTQSSKYYNRWYVVEARHLCVSSYVTSGRQPVKIYAGTQDIDSVVHQNVSGDGAESS